jgi:N-acetylglucosamine-6-phosphate deacetylase
LIDTTLEQPRGRFALTGGRIVLPNKVVTGQAIVIAGGKIVGLAEAGALGSDIEKTDVGGRTITPGLVDIHTHGALGHTFNEPTAEAFTTITDENARRGVTSLVATLATAPIPDLVRCLEFGRQWMCEPHPGSQVLGMHLESPYISPAQKGALDPADIRTPDDGTPDAC